jgi:D-glycero-D-manno-heptose 1,7-bisphosphate phosphatase
MRGAAIFDRDGVLIKDSGYVHRMSDVVWSPGVVEALQLCRKHGLLIFLVTNQSGVARGLFSESTLRAFHSELFGTLEKSGAYIDDVRYCPHHPEAVIEFYRRECSCRKPAPGMIEDLVSTWNIDKKHCFFVGDKPSDMEAARAAKVPGRLYAGGALDVLVNRAVDFQLEQRP